MHILIHSNHILPLAVASLHSLSDIEKPVGRLLPYFGLLFWPECVDTTVAFSVSSLLHFSKDVGLQGSVILHCAWILVALFFGVEAGFDTFLIYYCFVHAPMHFWEMRVPTLKLVLGLSILLWLLPFVCVVPTEFVFGDAMQRLVVLHAIVNVGKK